jgi:hypothetical protein
MELALKLTIGTGGESHSLELSRSIARDGRRFRVVEHRLHGAPSAADPSQVNPTATRFEAIFDGERLAVRRGHGPFIERDARDGLPARILSQMHDFGPAILTAFGDYLVLSPGAGRAPEVAGIRLAWSKVELDPAVAPKPMSESELAALRDHERHVFAWLAATLRPSQVTGRVAHVAGSDQSPERLVEAELTLSGGARGSVTSPPGGFTLDLIQRVSALGESAIASLRERAPADFTLPADLLPPDRPRPWKMIVDVLGDELLPPYRVERPVQRPASP